MMLWRYCNCMLSCQYNLLNYIYICFSTVRQMFLLTCQRYQRKHEMIYMRSTNADTNLQ